MLYSNGIKSATTEDMNRTHIKFNSKTAYCGYIYADGHAVLLHQESHPKAGEVQWAEIWEKLPVRCDFVGRIVFHNPRHDMRLALAVNAERIRATEPSIDHGSENTKRHNLRVASFEIDVKDGSYLHWTMLPDLISSGITYQPECVETFASLDGKYHWGSTRIDVTHRLPKSEVPTQAEA